MYGIAYISYNEYCKGIMMYRWHCPASGPTTHKSNCCRFFRIKSEMIRAKELPGSVGSEFVPPQLAPWLLRPVRLVQGSVPHLLNIMSGLRIRKKKILKEEPGSDLEFWLPASHSAKESILHNFNFN